MREDSAFCSYDVAERIDPNRSWEKKEPIEIASIEQTGTTESHFDQLISKFDNDAECFIHEKKIGICSVCTRPLTLETGQRCFYGCLACVRCSKKYNQRSICRKDVESRFASKTETKALICLIQGLSKQDAVIVSETSDQQLQSAIWNLETRRYVKFPFNSILNRPKVTPHVLEIMPLLIDTYREDADFAVFLSRLGEVE